MARVFVSPKARQDLFEIWDYHVQHSEESAEKAISLINKTFEALEGAPLLGRLRPALPGEGLRSFPTGDDVVFYTYNNADRVQVVRVLHQRRDVASTLSAEPEE